MPRKVRELEAELEQAGFIRFPGKGSHRVYKLGSVSVSISGQAGDDAKRYQEKAVAVALRKVRK